MDKPILYPLDEVPSDLPKIKIWLGRIGAIFLLPIPIGMLYLVCANGAWAVERPSGPALILVIFGAGVYSLLTAYILISEVEAVETLASAGCGPIWKHVVLTGLTLGFVVIGFLFAGFSIRGAPGRFEIEEDFGELLLLIALAAWGAWCAVFFRSHSRNVYRTAWRMWMVLMAIILLELQVAAVAVATTASRYVYWRFGPSETALCIGLAAATWLVAPYASLRQLRIKCEAERNWRQEQDVLDKLLE